jgi:predicted pyridoxine 5'-phosphate oxidase superfamily flavin-nucleotide-binding protein
MAADSPFHSGELAVQQRAGESLAGESNGTMISGTVMRGARPWVRQQTLAVLASRDRPSTHHAESAMWASLLFGRPGFLQADDGTHFSIDLKQALVDARDPLWRNIEGGGRLGALVIDLANRRRIRINGAAALDFNQVLRMDVVESYPNCPKYIARRVVHLPSQDVTQEDGVLDRPPDDQTVDEAARRTIHESDTFFIATESPERGLDASHRGGDPGFLKLAGPRTLRWPEFPGNSMYNTLGNLLQDPHAGIAIPDFERGRVLQLTGTAQTLWDQPDPADESGGTRRFVEFTIDRWHWLALPAHLTAQLIDYSPFNPPVAESTATAKR